MLGILFLDPIVGLRLSLLDVKILMNMVTCSANSLDSSLLPWMPLNLLRGIGGRLLHLLVLWITKALLKLKLRTKARVRREPSRRDTMMEILTNLMFL